VSNQTDEEWISETALVQPKVLLGKYIIGRYKVIFGWRIRGGYLHDDGCAFDVCCGTSETLLQLVETLYTAKILKNEELKISPFINLKAYSEIKPIHNDVKYISWLSELSEELHQDGRI